MTSPSRAQPVAPPRAVVAVLPFAGDDEALVAALKRRQPAAAAALCDRYGDHVRRVLGRILGVDAELPDVHQDVFLRAIEGAHTLADGRNLRGWLGVIAVNCARTVLKRRARRRWLGLGPQASEELPEVAVEVDQEAAEALARTYRALDKLPADERIAFTLRIVDGMPLDELAAVTGVSLATIKRRLAKAQQRFATLARGDEILRGWLEEGDRWA